MTNSNFTNNEHITTGESQSSQSIFSKTTPPKLSNINIMYKFFLVCATIVHLIFTVLFFVCRFPYLAVYNIFSTALYIVCINMFKIKRMRIIFAIVNFELMFFTLLSLIILGWNYNFFLYYFLIIQLTLISCLSRERNTYNLKFALLQFSIISIGLIFVYIYTKTSTPIYVVGNSLKTLFQIIQVGNFVSASTMSFLLNFAFIEDVNISNQRLANINNELNHIATHDPLTNLINRRSMNNHFYTAIDNYQKKAITFSLILADVDDFKKVNDLYGHDCGDIVLKRIAKIISDNVPEPGVVCRWGGEEILILTYEDVKQAKITAEKIRLAVDSTSFVFNNTYIKSTLTLGVAEYNPNISIGKVVSLADDNLYKGKKSTKNCVVA